MAASKKGKAIHRHMTDAESKNLLQSIISDFDQDLYIQYEKVKGAAPI